MKNFIMVSLSLLIIFGCMDSPAPKQPGSPVPKNPEPPRREFQSIDFGKYPANIPSIVNDFSVEDIRFSIGSIYFSTALFLADAGILDNTSKEIFKKYATALFTQFPREGDVKEIIIPGFSLSQKSGVEKDAYLFIYKAKTNDLSDYYRIETNIPIASINSRIYNGYVMQIDAGFYKNIVPARWVSIMSIMFKNDILLYRGVAYPSKSAPLIYTGTGIGSDVRMNAIVSGQATIAETASQLKNTVEQALIKTTAENQQQADSLKFLEKDATLSLAAYFYIDSDFNKAKEYFFKAKEMEAVIPNDIVGSKYIELEAIMEYLIKIL